MDIAMKVSGLMQTRDMLQGIQLQFDGSNVYIAGPTVDYAVYQELGTSRHPARPFLGPARDRVAGNIGRYAQKMSAKHGIPLDSEENIVKCVAHAVSEESAKIADAKGVRDTGELIDSHTVRKR